ncbi:MAG: cobalamin-binding protein [Chthonomonadales bacterium]|nr:cobalamin-binding protein [Chthonomonadales bacterium]
MPAERRPPTLQSHDVIGLVKPAVDAHTLGLATVASLLSECGYRTVEAETAVNSLLDAPMRAESADQIEEWIRSERITRLGMSYRLDPDAALEKLERLLWALSVRGLLAEQGGPIAAVYFAGLPEACTKVRDRHAGLVTALSGDASDQETLVALGVPAARIPSRIRETAVYDEARLAFGRDLIRRGLHHEVTPPERPSYPAYGAAADTLEARLRDAMDRKTLPLMRAHVGPYSDRREEAIARMLDWCRMLAASGYLDVLSLGTSQLTQSHFGQDWTGLANGGGVPVRTPEEYRALREAARPMLVRTYSGTRNVPAMARIHEEHVEIAWHALSLWWFCQLDGRGPNDLLTNLREHFEAMRYIARTGKPFEPNVPHHFMFRGADDVTYVVSAVLAARAAAACGIQRMVLQTMLNTPRRTSGIADLARVRAILSLLRSPQLAARCPQQVWLQPRAGLDYFSPDLDLARVQLAASTALMDDIEPANDASPQIVHVVSYCEAVSLATPPEVDESIRITRAALREYRRLRRAGDADDMGAHADVRRRTNELIADAQVVLQAIEDSVPDPYTPDGFYRIYQAGFLPTPDLWHCRDEFPHAIARRTAMVDGQMVVVDHDGAPIPAAVRAQEAAEEARKIGGSPDVIRLSVGPTGC